MSDPNAAPLQDILTPLDEVAFWLELATNPALAGPATKAAQQVHAYLEAIRAPFDAMAQASVNATTGALGSGFSVSTKYCIMGNALLIVCVDMHDSVTDWTGSRPTTCTMNGL